MAAIFADEATEQVAFHRPLRRTFHTTPPSSNPQWRGSYHESGRLVVTPCDYRTEQRGAILCQAGERVSIGKDGEGVAKV